MAFLKGQILKLAIVINFKFKALNFSKPKTIWIPRTCLSMTLLKWTRQRKKAKVVLVPEEEVVSEEEEEEVNLSEVEMQDPLDALRAEELESLRGRISEEPEEA